jgi:cell division septal protein FtsQ
MFKLWSRREQKTVQNPREQRIKLEKELNRQRERDRSQLAVQRQKELRRQEFNAKVIAVVTKYFRRLIVIVSILLVLFLSGFAIFKLHSEQVYIIKQISFHGNQRISSEQLHEVLDPYLGRSMLLVSKRELEGVLRQKFTFLKTVFVRKLLPGRVEIELAERRPVTSLINLTGAYMIDDESQIVGVLHQVSAEGLTFEQSQIVSGYGDVNAPVVQEFYLSKIEKQEDKDKVKWEEVPVKDKESALREIQQNLTARLRLQLEEGRVKVEESNFKDLPRIYSYDALTFNLGDSLDKVYLTYTQRIWSYFETSATLKAEGVLWESIYLIKLTTNQGKTFFFSSTDDVELQLEKLDAVIENGILTRGSEFDLRGKKIVAR